MVYVTKVDGSKQFFDREKVVKTCMRMGASHQLALQVARKVEERVYEGMQTRKILQLIFRFMRKDKPGVSHMVDLRKALSLMNSKPEFETFVQAVLKNSGFEVSPNRILRGRCVEHEVDAVASKDGVTYFVEAKHHLSYHALIGLDESRIARAVLEDVSEGYQAGVEDLRIDKAMIVANTRYSEHAIRYCHCKGIVQVGWNYPVSEGIEKMVADRNLHPLSCLKGLSNDDRLKLVESGWVLIRQLVDVDVREVVAKTGLEREKVEEVLESARQLAFTLEY